MVHDQFELHDEAFRSETKARQKKERRQTQNRVIARLRIRKTKALSKVPMFKKISPEVIESILECTTYEKHKAGDILCTQGDVATDFYIIVSGQCDIYVTAKAVDGDTQLPRKVGSLKDLDYFGENALLEGAKKRNATVKAESEYVQVLLLSRMNFELLVEGGLLTADILSTVTKESKRREELTRKSFEIVDETKTLEEEDCWAVLNQ
jgi:CRP-like cAMP-binding protein